MNTRGMVVLSFVMLFVAAACGQKPGVAEQPPPFQDNFGLPAGAQIDPETGQIVDAEGNVIGEVGASDLPDAETGLSAPGEAASGDVATRGGGSTSGPASSSGPPTAGDATGVTDAVIKIGAHAPLTGAAPLPSESTQKGNDLYWRWLERTDRSIAGRRVETMLKNDQYNPSSAVAICKEMVEKDRVFLLYGFAGTDQIQACARYAASVGVPYVSAGVTERGLTGLPNYFAISMSYPDQAPLLADYLTTSLGARNEKNGMLWFQTASFEDAHSAFLSAMDRSRAQVHYDRAVAKSAGVGDARTVVQEMKARGIENVYVLTSPVWFLQVLQEARSQGYEPQWVGVGLTKAIDTVASVGCRNGTINGAKFFSPFPAWAEIDRYDADFKKAVQAIYPEEGGGDDIMLIGWGFAKVLARLLELPGENLTRESFVYHGERAGGIRTGVYPPVSFSPNNRFGSRQVHVNEAQCSGYKAGDNRWHTIKSFVSDF